MTVVVVADAVEVVVVDADKLHQNMLNIVKLYHLGVWIAHCWKILIAFDPPQISFAFPVHGVVQLPGSIGTAGDSITLSQSILTTQHTPNQLTGMMKIIAQILTAFLFQHGVLEPSNSIQSNN